MVGAGLGVVRGAGVGLGVVRGAGMASAFGASEEAGAEDAGVGASADGAATGAGLTSTGAASSDEGVADAASDGDAVPANESVGACAPCCAAGCTATCWGAGWLAGLGDFLKSSTPMAARTATNRTARMMVSSGVFDFFRGAARQNGKREQ